MNKVIKDSDVLEESEIISCLVSASKSEALFGRVSGRQEVHEAKPRSDEVVCCRRKVARVHIAEDRRMAREDLS